MPNITKADALRIIKKLQAAPADASGRQLRVEIRQSGPHDVVKVWYGPVYVGRFGVQRTSNKNAQHNYIPEQIHLTRSQDIDFASCTLTADDYMEILLADDGIRVQFEKNKT